MTQGWTTLDALRPGTIFETEQGLRYVKQDRAQLTDAESVVFLGDGSVEHFEPGTRVMPVALPPVRPVSDDTEDPVHAWFELTYAQYLTIPRSLLESMPVSWQRGFVDCLEELEATFDWR